MINGRANLGGKIYSKSQVEEMELQKLNNKENKFEQSSLFKMLMEHEK